MNVIPFVHEGLGNSSYLVELGASKAALIDPDRSIDRYLNAAQSRGWGIISIFETHLHADFISGGLEAAGATGAGLYLPAGAEARFPHDPLTGGQRVSMQGVEVEAVASPGHTPEHFNYLFRWERGPAILFSGGSIIVGGAARTDLIAPEMTEPLTRAQYRTLKSAFSSLGDDTMLYPTHGGGSFCSMGSGSQRVSTLGEERAHNPLLSMGDEEEFLRWFPTTFPAVPAYFSRMRPVNQAGPRPRREIVAPPGLSPEEFDALREKALVIDVRPVEEYMEAHIPGSLSNAYRDVYAIWLGWLVEPEIPLLFVLGEAPLGGVIEQSLLVGHERFAGWLEGGMESWAARGLLVQGAKLMGASQARKALLEGWPAWT